MHELKKRINKGLEDYNAVWHEALKDSQKNPDGILDLSAVIFEQAKVRSQIDEAFMEWESRQRKSKNSIFGGK